MAKGDDLARGTDQQANAGADQQATQQDMNSQATQKASQPAAQRPNQQTITVQGKEVPFFPAPPGHASSNITRLAQVARQQERDNANPGIPDSAGQSMLSSAKHVPMPAGGLHALASQLWPDDVANNEAMDGHLADLLNLNRDTLRDDTTTFVGQSVRVPA